MNFPSPNKLQATWKARLKRDLGAAIAIPLFFLLFAVIFDFSDQLIAWIKSVEPWEVDEFFLTTFVLSLTLAWFAYRRWRDLGVEIVQRKQMDEVLRESQERYQSVVNNIEALKQEISERRHTQEAQRQAEQRYRNLFEEAPLMYVITRNQAGQPIIVDCNQSFLSTLGYSRDEVLQRPLANFYTPDSRTKLLEGGYQRALTNGFMSEERQLVTRDGRIIETLLRALPETNAMGEVNGTRAMFVDITERIRAEAEIRRRNRELALLNQIIAAVAADIDIEALLETACRDLALVFDLPQTAIFLLNEDRTEVETLAEYLVNERPSLLDHILPLADNPSWQYLIGHDRPLVINDAQSDPRLKKIRDLLRQRGTVAFLLIPLIINGQVVGKLSLEALEPRDFSPEEINLAWNVADQLAGALARARLIQTQQRLTTVIEQSVESVVVADTQGVILYVNPAFERISGYCRAEVLGQNFRALYAFEQDQSLLEQAWAAISSGQVWQGRIVSQTKDGKFYTEDVILSPVRDESEAIVNYVAIKRDVTRELQLEEQYHQAQKMEAIGQLAGGIAHDFNNLLTVINGYSELLLERYLKEDDSSRKYLEEILHAGGRASTLTRQLLAFSRKQVLQPQVLDLNTVVVQLDKMLGRLISEDIELTTLLAPNLTPIRADQGQVEQVLLNLVVNARDAMPDGGKLTIKTANAVLDQNYASQHAEVNPGKYALIAVSDTGIGMTEEVKAHIFEPFFTTKAQGKGTGLGLATCFGIVKQSGGHIGVYSEPGRGTTFKVYLPAIAAKAAPVLELDEAKPLPQGTETILLVEDGPAVRALAAQLLREQGYMVVEAANGEEALRLAQTQAKLDIHLLLTDVIMPQMGGKELADRLRDEYPNLKVLFASGYTDDTIVRHGVLEPGIAFLEKPFTMITLVCKVREVLDT